MPASQLPSSDTVSAHHGPLGSLVWSRDEQHAEPVFSFQVTGACGSVRCDISDPAEIFLADIQAALVHPEFDRRMIAEADGRFVSFTFAKDWQLIPGTDDAILVPNAWDLSRDVPRVDHRGAEQVPAYMIVEVFDVTGDALTGLHKRLVGLCGLERPEVERFISAVLDETERLTAARGL